MLIAYKLQLNEKYILWNVYLPNTVAFHDLDSESSRSSKAKGYGANQKPMGGFLSDLFESNIVSLTIFEIFDSYFFIGAMVRINSTSGLADRNISDFHQKQ